MTLDATREGAPASRSTVTGPDLTGITVFRAGVQVRDCVTAKVHDCAVAVSPVSAGFVALRAERLAADYRVVLGALRLGRPVALAGDASAAAAALAAETGSRWLCARDPSEVHFLVPPAFIRSRVAAIRRRQSAGSPPAGMPYQRIAAVGVGPHPHRTETDAEVREVLDRAEAVVATDWTYANTLQRVSLAADVARHVVPYDIADYDRTIAGFNDILTSLQVSGVSDVALLIEGNPDTLDVLDGVCPVRRGLRVIPGVPIAVAAAGELGSQLTPSPFASGLAYLSGLPGRHEQTQADLLDELTCYLGGGLACVLVEMTFSDIGIALEAVRRAPVPKTLMLLADFYSPTARALFLRPGSPGEARAVIERGRGMLSTLLIFDDPTGDVARSLL